MPTDQLSIDYTPQELSLAVEAIAKLVNENVPAERIKDFHEPLQRIATIAKKHAQLALQQEILLYEIAQEPDPGVKRVFVKYGYKQVIDQAFREAYDRAQAQLLSRQQAVQDEGEVHHDDQ
jgi:hypothetical protein